MFYLITRRDISNMSSSSEEDHGMKTLPFFTMDSY